MAVSKTGDIHVDVGNLYYDQYKQALVNLQNQMDALVAQQKALQLEINAAVPVDLLARQTEFVTDLAAYLISKGAANAAERTAFFVGASAGQPFSTILGNMDAYLAAGGV